MKTITLDIEDDVYRDLRTQAGLRIAMGESHGIVDAFVALLIKSIDEGTERKHVQRKAK